ncbi:melanoma-associated antigen G1-like [Pyrus ussuriensis x Pyrus communis]|uniref:Melanoma-associated antigen G1-like n=1 Tax=Pyrus ussuriensis x Pyrus communis TaxID=2448454 RepID=A0A5N5GNE5_9ROSA|nr:melanoma-associated antigen G1-like [Pyrus ussuriensis x Pyrus communis]
MLEEEETYLQIAVAKSWLEKEAGLCGRSLPSCHQELSLVNLPTFIINEAIQKLSAIFGYEMLELQRSRPSSANQGRLSQQSAVEAKSYIITSKLPSDVYKKYVLNDNGSTVPLNGFTFVLLSLVHISGSKMTEGIYLKYCSLYQIFAERQRSCGSSLLIRGGTAFPDQICGGLALLGSRLWRISLEVVKLQVEMSQSLKSQPEDFVSRIIIVNKEIVSVDVDD